MAMGLELVGAAGARPRAVVVGSAHAVSRARAAPTPAKLLRASVFIARLPVVGRRPRGASTSAPSARQPARLNTTKCKAQRMPAMPTSSRIQRVTDDGHERGGARWGVTCKVRRQRIARFWLE